MSRVATELTSAIYTGASDWGTYVPFVDHLVAEPPVGAPVVDMLSALPPHIADRYRDIADLDLPAAELECDIAAVSKRYHRFGGGRRQWIQYLRREEVWQLWDLVPLEEVELFTGVAAVLKKDGPAQRKILQSIPFNASSVSPERLIGEPFDYGLVGGSGLA